MATKSISINRNYTRQKHVPLYTPQLTRQLLPVATPRVGATKERLKLCRAKGLPTNILQPEHQLGQRLPDLA